jgi:hypothetical protein
MRTRGSQGRERLGKELITYATRSSWSNRLPRAHAPLLSAVSLGPFKPALGHKHRQAIAYEKILLLITSSLCPPEIQAPRPLTFSCTSA